jgi:hypothetical protein
VDPSVAAALNAGARSPTFGKGEVPSEGGGLACLVASFFLPAVVAGVFFETADFADTKT